DEELLGVIVGGRKAIWSPVDEERALFFDDWRRDAASLDRARDRPADLDRLRALGAADPGRMLALETTELSERTRRALHALGYLDAPPSAVVPQGGDRVEDRGAVGGIERRDEADRDDRGGDHQERTRGEGPGPVAHGRRGGGAGETQDRA